MDQPIGLKNGHSRRNLTRRQLLSHGLAASVGVALASPLAMLLERTALAGQPSTRIPFLHIDGSGGGNIAGSNVIVGKAGGQLDFLSSYSGLGLPDEMHPSKSGQVDTTLGLAFHADSAFLRGIRSVASDKALASVDGVVIPGFSLDDSHDNQQSPAHWIYRWGRRGSLAQLIGNQGASSTGGNTAPAAASFIRALRPLPVWTTGDAVNIASVGKMQSNYPYDNRGSNDRAARVLRATAKFNERVLTGIPEAELAQAHRENIRASYGALTTALGVNRTELDPAQDAIVSALYPGVANSPPGDEGTMTVSINKLLLDGFAACGAITLGGFDYHTLDRATGELADFRLGRAIGLSLELASRKNKDLFIYVSTDGAQNSYRTSIDNSPDGRGKLGWNGDSGTMGASFILVHKAGASGRPTILKPSRQYGAFSDSNAVDMASSPVAGLPERQAAFVFLNYLALHGSEGDFGPMLGTANPFPAPLGDHLFFGKMIA